MSPVEESVVKKIKNKFNMEVEAIKQRQQDRSKFQQKIVRTSKQTPTKFIKPKKPPIRHDEKEQTKAAPVFVEKAVKKEVKTSHERTPYKKSDTYRPQRSSSYQGRDQQNRSKPTGGTYQKSGSDSSRYNKSASDRGPRQFAGKYPPRTDRFGTRTKPTGGTGAGSKQEQQDIKNTLAEDARSGIPFVDYSGGHSIMSIYSQWLDPNEIFRIYNANSPFGVATEDDAELAKLGITTK